MVAVITKNTRLEFLNREIKEQQHWLEFQKEELEFMDGFEEDIRAQQDAIDSTLDDLKELEDERRAILMGK